MNRITLGVILLAICSSLSSCSFHWHITRKDVKKHANNTDTSLTTVHTILPQPDTAATTIAPDTSGKVKQLIAQLTPVWDARIDYKTFSGKARIHFSGPDNDRVFTAHFRIRKDSVIWINVTFDAIPVARLFITRDSFFLLNTVDQEVTMIPLSQAAKVLPTKVDFTSLQNLATGEPLRKGKITDAVNIDNSWAIQVEDSNYIQHITISKADSTISSGQLRTRDPKGPQAITSYSSYEMISNRKISTYRTLNIQNGNDTYSLEMNFTRTDFDEPLDFPFSIPKSYTVKTISNTQSANQHH